MWRAIVLERSVCLLISFGILDRKPKQSNQQQYVFNRNNNNNNGINNKRNGNDGWAGEDVDIFREEEFDFQKNLNMFDKAKIFAEIRVITNNVYIIL